MSNGQGPGQPSCKFYLVIHIATTCDEHGVYVTRDSAEVIELGWLLLNATSLEEIHRESVLVKPISTPITPLCTSLTTLTWEHVNEAGTFRDAITKLDNFVQEHVEAQDFSFIAFDSWNLRVQLPREARDKAVILPQYLQHTCAYDLRNEYQKWQNYNPDSIPFASTSITSICSALGLEPVQPSAPIKHNLPFHLQALAPASPRRALEEATILARILRGLIQKSSPKSEYPDIMTRPLDARADVQAFLAEKSKIVYMCGLPHDTTQSELESWFTQFGGRPIAFWTLRTPDQQKPTGTGFAVFSSHDEAAESLCMNGYALNEKAVEVSPSSHRVLDRASDILTPFPPSKNRPRPGDWTCPSCGFSNFQRRTACFRCSFPAGSGSQLGDTYSYGNPMRYGQYNTPHMPRMAHPGGHNPGHPRGGNGSMVPFRAGDWKCGSEGCGYHNFAKNITCLRCGASRASAAIVAESTYSAPLENMPNYGSVPGRGLQAQASAMYGGSTNSFAPTTFSGHSFHHASDPLSLASPSNGVFHALSPFTPNSALSYNNNTATADTVSAAMAFNAPSHGTEAQVLASSSGEGYANTNADTSANHFAFLSPAIAALNITDDSGSQSV